MDRFYFGLLALAGGLASALSGWFESKETFDWRKFGGSVIRALVAAAVFAASYELSGTIGILDMFYAFLGGAGVDVLGNRISGKFGNGSFPFSASTKPDEPPPQV
jgi:hypothetical protein